MIRLKILFLIIPTLFFSCKKEQKGIIKNMIFNIDSNCTDTEISTLDEPPQGFSFHFDSNFVSMPFFNPNDPSEFIYYNQYSTNNIYIYNRATNTKKFLTTAILKFPPKWGKNNWVLLDNGVINKIKINGDSLQELSIGYNPEWNHNSTKIAYHTTNWNIGKNIGVIYDFESNSKDTLPFMLNGGKCWQNQSNKMVFYSSEETMKGFVLIDMNTQTRTLLNKIDSPTPPCWINENEFVFCLNQYLWVFNTITHESKAITKLCSNEHVSYLSYSPISKELLAAVDHWKAEDAVTIFVSSKIMILNFANNSVSFIKP
jgi:hypothetical protein